MGFMGLRLLFSRVVLFVEPSDLDSSGRRDRR